MSTSNIAEDLHLSFDKAQALFSSYYTFHTDDRLKDSLFDVLGPLVFDTYNSGNNRDLINKIILKYYPNEISVKSNFINKVLLKSNNHVTIFELPIGNSRIDLCKLNGSSVGYEIKTDLDNLYRLEKQLNDYLEIFEKVFVICSENKKNDVKKCIVPNCGIYTYSISKYGNYKFTLYQKAMKSQNINSEKQLNILRKSELIKYFAVGTLTNRKDITASILNKYSFNKINKIFKTAIKIRYENQWGFLRENKSRIFEIDYQWFFKNNINPSIIYN